MPIWWPPPTTCSESPVSSRPPYEAPLHHTAARAATGENHRAQRLTRPLSPPWQSNWLIKPFPQQPARWVDADAIDGSAPCDELLRLKDHSPSISPTLMTQARISKG